MNHHHSETNERLKTIADNLGCGGITLLVICGILYYIAAQLMHLVAILE